MRPKRFTNANLPNDRPLKKLCHSIILWPKNMAKEPNGRIQFLGKEWRAHACI